MSPGVRFHVLVATDGSAPARAAVVAAAGFPWPRGADASGVVVRGEVPPELSPASRRALDVWPEGVAAGTRTALAARWPRADVAIVSGPVASAILAEARRRHAAVVVVGEQKRGVVSRFFLGSVSRRVVREARSPILVVRGRPEKITSVVVGVDGSSHARRAVDLVGRLLPSRGSRAAVVRVLEPIFLPSLGRLPAHVRRVVSAQAAADHARRLRAVRREVDEAVSRLSRAGWRARGAIRIGSPVDELLRAARESGAGLVVVGARGTGGVQRLLLGSVADTVLARSPVSVLVVR